MFAAGWNGDQGEGQEEACDMSEWVSVKERMPTDGYYLVHCPSADENMPLITTAWWNEESQRWDFLIDYWAKGITHWQPLPDPPR